MKFYCILIITFTDGSADKVGIYTLNSENEAIKAFYSYMGQYVNATNVDNVPGKDVKTLCVEAKNNVGGVYKHESWSATAAANVE